MTALRAVDDQHLEHARANRTFASVALKAKRAQKLLEMPEYGWYPNKATTARCEARDMISELMAVADLPTYHAALRVLHEVRRELGTKDPDLEMLRRNLTLFLDGEPEG